MIGQIQWIAEIILILNTLRWAYGKKEVKLCYILGVIIVDLVVMNLIVEYDFADVLVILIYILIIAYSILEYGKNINELLVNMVLCFIICSCLQSGGAVIAGIATLENDMAGMFINVFAVILESLLYFKIDLHRVSIYLQKENRMKICIMIICIAALSHMIINIRVTNKVFLDGCIIIATSVIIIIYLFYEWQVSRYRSKILMRNFLEYKINNEAYKDLISEIRYKQHDYKNLLNGILCLQKNYNTYEELVSAQNEYCVEMVKTVNQSIIDTGDSAISAFIFSKISCVKNKNIKFECTGRVGIELSVVVIMDIIQILGNLLDNAIEELEMKKGVIMIHFFSDSIENGFEVRNTIDDDKQIKITDLMRMGYSTKGKMRGYGLANIEEICNEHGWKLLVKIEEGNPRWISFQIII